jgi:oligopeptide/dipeptide ABC transporter ATP-binding protein
MSASRTDRRKALDPNGAADRGDVGERRPTLSVADLGVTFDVPGGGVRAVNGASFEVRRGEILGLVGESGCGKSVTARTIMGLLHPPARVSHGTVTYRTRRGDVVPVIKDGSVAAGSTRLRGDELAMIFQDPSSSLNPVYTVGNQLAEVERRKGVSDRQARERGLDTLARVGVPDPERLIDAYPHQLSGGLKQRVMIGIALACEPSLLIADEPTTALDVTTQAQILALLSELQAEQDMSVLFITHNIAVVAQLCDRVGVMYLGSIVESGPVAQVLAQPRHPYTISLLRSMPQFGRRGEPLETIRGTLPAGNRLPAGCAFHPRCPVAVPGLCDVEPPPEVAATAVGDVTARCHLVRPADGSAT